MSLLANKQMRGRSGSRQSTHTLNIARLESVKKDQARYDLTEDKIYRYKKERLPTFLSFNAVNLPQEWLMKCETFP